MPELQRRLERLVLRLDHMGLRVEQAVADSIDAVRKIDAAAAERVEAADSIIDREEVEIEQECIRLLALYQPAAIDLRTICFIIKANSDLERIGDKAVSISRRVKHVVSEGLNLKDYPGFDELVDLTSQWLGRTVRLMTTRDAKAAQVVIQADSDINRAYKQFVRNALDLERAHAEGGVDAALTLIFLGRALERIGDLCTNIAEDLIFLSTGEIVRHAAAFETDRESKE